MHVLILGGAKSGKSSNALRLGEEIIREASQGQTRGAGLFVATAQAHDAEMEERIKLHRLERGDMWHTEEEPLAVPSLIRRKGPQFRVVLVDCLTLWLSNLMHSCPDDIPEHVADLCNVLSELSVPVIMVSNEVGLGIVPASPEARRFRDLAGRLHQDVAAVCKHVLFVVAGIPMLVKGGMSFA